MAAIEQFEDIKAWQIAREITKIVYAATKADAFSRDFGLRDQITRASGSIMHTSQRVSPESNAKFGRFLGYAKRSCTEVQSDFMSLSSGNTSTRDFQSLYHMQRSPCRTRVHQVTFASGRK